MRWLGGTTPEGRADLPDVLAPEGAAWDDRRRRSVLALVDATTVGCVPLAERPRAFPAIAFLRAGGRMRAAGIAPEGIPRDGLSRQGMRSP